MESKKQQFTSANLFTSPGNSAGLSLGLADNFSSPFSIGTPLATTSDVQGSKYAPLVTPSKSSSSSQRSSPAPVDTVVAGKEDPTPNDINTEHTSGSVDEMSTVSLDSPTVVPSVSDSLPTSSESKALRSSTTDGAVIDQGRQGVSSGRERGWNDPPSLYGGTPSRPNLSRTTSSPVTLISDDIQIQPLANHPDPHETNQAQGPPPSLGTDGAGSNPYRIGMGIGSRKAAYSSTGIASFGSAGIPGQASHPVMYTPQANYQQQTGVQQSTGFHPVGQLPPDTTPPPPTSGFVSSSSSSSYSSSPSTDSVDSGLTGRRTQPIRYHWFYLRSQEKYWIPFSLVDSKYLEKAGLNNQDPSQQLFVPTDGGRYDVDLHSRLRQAVYWDEPVSQVRRCSWFYKGEADRWYLPYDEVTALRLEEEYQAGLNQLSWNRKVEVEEGGSVIMHSHSSIVHYSPAFSSSLNLDESHGHPKAVVRGFADIDKVETGEQVRIDHLVFIVHGIGAHHDLSFRSLVDCVDDFREVSQLMLKTHQFSNQGSRDGDGGGRVEFLPVHWHAKLHTSGVDECLKPLTLPSISRLRDFTNSTLLDILYFTSPLFCQTIISEVATEMNRMFELFQARNPSFQGGVSVVGHSLGSVILFDLLYHQQKDSGPHLAATTNLKDREKEENSTQGVPVPMEGDSELPGSGGNGDDTDDGTTTTTVDEVLTNLGLESLVETFQKEQIDLDSLLMCCNDDLKELGLAMGPRKKLTSFISQQNDQQKLAKKRKEREMAEKLEKERKEREAREVTDAAAITSSLLGVKIIRGLAGTGQTFMEYPQLSFHPQHLFALGSPIGLFLTVRGVEELGPNFMLPTCPGVFNIFHPFDPVAYRIEPLVTDSAPTKAVLMPHHKGRKRFHLELYENLGHVGASIKQHFVDGMKNMWQQLNEFARSHTTGSQTIDEIQEVTSSELHSTSFDTVDSNPSEEEVTIGVLNQGRRIDHVLQEKPIEKLNEYLFALSSHLCYWHSEDTALFLLKEAYQEPHPLLIN